MGGEVGLLLGGIKLQSNDTSSYTNVQFNFFVVGFFVLIKSTL